jgi:hypothetical protein
MNRIWAKKTALTLNFLRIFIFFQQKEEKLPKMTQTHGK